MRHHRGVRSKYFHNSAPFGSGHGSEQPFSATPVSRPRAAARAAHSVTALPEAGTDGYQKPTPAFLRFTATIVVHFGRDLSPHYPSGS